MNAFSGIILMALFIVSTAFTVSADESAGPSQTDISVEYVYALPSGDTGPQVFPVPGGSKDVDAYAIACWPAGSDAITGVDSEIRAPGGLLVDVVSLGMVPEKEAVQGILKKTVSSGLMSQSASESIADRILTDRDCMMYAKTFDLSYKDPAGFYEIKATAHDASGGTDVKTGSFEYASVTALEVDFSNLNFGELESGVEAAASRDQGVNGSVPGIRNIGNIVSNIVVSAGPMQTKCGDGSVGLLPAEALSARIGRGKRTLSEQGALFQVGLLPGDSATADFFLAPPPGICRGRYYGSISIEAVPVALTTSTTTSTMQETTTTQLAATTEPNTVSTAAEHSTTTTVDESPGNSFPESTVDETTTTMSVSTSSSSTGPTPDAEDSTFETTTTSEASSTASQEVSTSTMPVTQTTWASTSTVTLDTAPTVGETSSMPAGDTTTTIT